MTENLPQNSPESVTNEALQKLSDAPQMAEHVILEEALPAAQVISNAKAGIEQLVTHTQDEIRRLAAESGLDSSKTQGYLDRLTEAQKTAFDALAANKETYQQIEDLVHLRSATEVWTEVVNDNANLMSSPEFVTPLALAELEKMRPDLQDRISKAEQLPVPANLAGEKGVQIAALHESAQKFDDTLDTMRKDLSHNISAAVEKADAVSAMVAPDIDALSNATLPSSVAQKPAFQDILELKNHLVYLENFQQQAAKLSEHDPLRVQAKSALANLETTLSLAQKAFTFENPPLEKALADYGRYQENLRQALFHVNSVRKNPGATPEEKKSAQGWLAGAQQNFDKAVHTLRPLLSPEDQSAFRIGTTETPLYHVDELPPVSERQESVVVFDQDRLQAVPPSVQPAEKAPVQQPAMQNGGEAGEGKEGEAQPVETAKPVAKRDESQPKEPVPTQVGQEIPETEATKKPDTVLQENWDRTQAAMRSSSGGGKETVAAAPKERSKKFPPGLQKALDGLAQSAAAPLDGNIDNVLALIAEHGLNDPTKKRLEKVGFTFPSHMEPGQRITVQYRVSGTDVKREHSFTLPKDTVGKPAGSPVEKVAQKPTESDGDPLNPEI